MIEPLTTKEAEQIYSRFPKLKEAVNKGGFVETPDGIGVLKDLAKCDGILVANLSLGIFTSKHYEVFFSKENEDYLFGYSSRKFAPIKI